MRLRSIYKYNASTICTKFATDINKISLEDVEKFNCYAVGTCGNSTVQSKMKIILSFGLSASEQNLLNTLMMCSNEDYRI